MPSYNGMKKDESILSDLADLIAERAKDAPPGSYTAELLSRGNPLACKKLIEEAAETALAAVCEPKQRLVEESADLLYHLLVLWQINRTSPRLVWECLAKRAEKGKKQ